MYRCVKRVFDFVSALLLLVVSSPLLFVLAVLVRLNLGSPVFFTQERTGKKMRRFKLIKFRTMTNACDSSGKLLPDHQRATRFGRFLRSSSLDELPELINIIKGDMSIIGPRPLPPRYDSYYSEYEKKRFDVRGGLITPDSVDRSPIIPWDKQLEYEANYAERGGLLLDLKIMVGVFRILFKRNATGYGSFERRPLDVERGSIKGD